MGKLNKLPGLKRPRRVMPLVIAVLAIVILALVVHNLNSPAQGSINQPPATQAVSTDPYAHPGQFKGKYVSFNYPAHFKAVPAKLTGNYLEVAAYSATDSTDKQLNLGVSPGTIDSDSGVAYRRLHKDLYRENDSRLGTEFIKLDGTEDTFFIQHGGLLASVSATAPYGGLNGESLFVVSSLQWL